MRAIKFSCFEKECTKQSTVMTQPITPSTFQLPWYLLVPATYDNFRAQVRSSTTQLVEDTHADIVLDRPWVPCNCLREFSTARKGPTTCDPKELETSICSAEPTRRGGRKASFLGRLLRAPLSLWFFTNDHAPFASVG